MGGAGLGAGRRQPGREQMEQLHVDMLSSMEVLHAITAFVSVRGQPTREEFRRFVTRPGATAGIAGLGMGAPDSGGRT